MEEDSVDVRGLGGWKEVSDLATALVDVYSTKGISISNSSATDILRLCNNLTDYDKKRTIFPEHVIAEPTGRFARNKRNSATVTAVKR